uniref:DUF834 domain-containing protein n=1 Tax=Oryza rufipogon TaxID=4529 RepID=A0A0E0NYM9_ORYRU
MVERPQQRRPSVFPSDTHPGKWSPSEGVRGGGRNGDGRSSTPAIREGGGGEGKGEKWILLVEANAMAQGNRKRINGGGDRPVVGDGQPWQERERRASSSDVGEHRATLPTIYRSRRGVCRGGRRFGHGDGNLEEEKTAPVCFLSGEVCGGVRVWNTRTGRREAAGLWAELGSGSERKRRKNSAPL